MTNHNPNFFLMSTNVVLNHLLPDASSGDIGVLFSALRDRGVALLRSLGCIFEAHDYFARSQFAISLNLSTIGIFLHQP
jgi:hypothetical protein